MERQSVIVINDFTNKPRISLVVRTQNKDQRVQEYRSFIQRFGRVSDTLLRIGILPFILASGVGIPLAFFGMALSVR